MASITPIGKKFRAAVGSGKNRRYKTFDTKTKAKQWAAEIEYERTKEEAPSDRTFGELMTKYQSEVTPRKRGAEWESMRIDKFLRDPIADVKLSDFGKNDVREWRDRSLKSISGSSVIREWSILSHACTIAIKDWDWMTVNPFPLVTKPKKAEPRNRRPTADEIERVLICLGYDDEGDVSSIGSRVGLVFLFAMETAVRTREMCLSEWENVRLDERYIYLPKEITKNGHARSVPLSKEAIRLIEKAKGVDDVLVFGLEPSQVDANFRKATKAAGVVDLHFHDTRREALSRLAKKMDVLKLARISGHRDLTILQNTYYEPDVQDLVELID